MRKTIYMYELVEHLSNLNSELNKLKIISKGTWVEEIQEKQKEIDSFLEKYKGVFTQEFKFSDKEVEFKGF